MRRRRPKTLPMGGTQVHIIGIPGDEIDRLAWVRQASNCEKAVVKPNQFLELKAVLRRNSFSYNAPFEIEYTFQY